MTVPALPASSDVTLDVVVVVVVAVVLVVTVVVVVVIVVVVAVVGVVTSGAVLEAAAAVGLVAAVVVVEAGVVGPMQAPKPSHWWWMDGSPSWLQEVPAATGSLRHVASGPKHRDGPRHALASPEQVVRVQALATHAEGGPSEEEDAVLRV